MLPRTSQSRAIFKTIHLMYETKLDAQVKDAEDAPSTMKLHRLLLNMIRLGSSQKDCELLGQTVCAGNTVQLN